MHHKNLPKMSETKTQTFGEIYCISLRNYSFSFHKLISKPPSHRFIIELQTQVCQRDTSEIYDSGHRPGVFQCIQLFLDKP